MLLFRLASTMIVLVLSDCLLSAKQFLLKLLRSQIRKLSHCDVLVLLLNAHLLGSCGHKLVKSDLVHVTNLALDDLSIACKARISLFINLLSLNWSFLLNNLLRNWWLITGLP